MTWGLKECQGENQWCLSESFIPQAYIFFWRQIFHRFELTYDLLPLKLLSGDLMMYSETI